MRRQRYSERHASGEGAYALPARAGFLSSVPPPPRVGAWSRRGIVVPLRLHRPQAGEARDLADLLLVGVKVDRRRLELGVTEPGLDRPEVGAVPEEPGRRGVPDRVRLD